MAPPLSTPYQLHWDNLAAWQSHFERGDLVALTISAKDARALDGTLTEQQAREALRILATDPAVIAELLARHLPDAIAQAKAENPGADQLQP